MGKRDQRREGSTKIGEIRYAKAADLPWLQGQDIHVNHQWIRRCISQKEYILAEQDTALLGFLRFSFFWGAIPFLDMIRVLPDHQRQGIGTALFFFWEKEMAQRQAPSLITSAVSSEQAPQAWHIRNGFRPCGKITFGKFQPESETFFVKDFRSPLL